jgi:arylsulfatase A-like enzyme
MRSMKNKIHEVQGISQCEGVLVKRFVMVLLLIALFGLLSCSTSSHTRLSSAEAPAATGASGNRPNVILILADDLGYGQLGIQGDLQIPTPHIDSIAQNGIRFTSGYVSCPVCSPTRAGLMTGRYQQRFGHEFNPGGNPPDFGLSPTEVTLAERMKSLGYLTGIVGKWHLGNREPSIPTERGFDEFFGFLGGAHQYFVSDRTTKNPILRDKRAVQEPEYLTDAFTREAVAFIERHKNEPFFLYLSYNAVHAPLQAPENYLSRFTQIKNKRRRTFAAMLSAMDDGVGQVLGKLRELNLEERTLVIFLSDNGGPTRSTTSRNDPLRGFKGQVMEGGIRIPFLVQWKGHLPAGKVYDHPVISLDIYPTAFAAADGTIQSEWNLDGVNLLPYLRGEIAGIPHDTLFWRFGQQWAVRRGNWKLVKQNASTPPKLFNLEADIHEDHDLASSKPDVAKELRGIYEQWNSQLQEPRWHNVKRTANPPQQKK